MCVSRTRFVVRVGASVVLATLVACGSGDANPTGVQTPARNATSAQSARVEILGQITGTASGEHKTWYVTGTKDEPQWRSQSDWNGTLIGRPNGTVNIFGLVDETRTIGSQGALIIGFSLAESADGYRAMNPTIDLHAESTAVGRHSSSGGGVAAIELSQAYLSGDMLRLTGTFTARLPFRDFSSAESEAAKSIVIEDGRFDVALPPLRK